MDEKLELHLMTGMELIHQRMDRIEAKISKLISQQGGKERAGQSECESGEYKCQECGSGLSTIDEFKVACPVSECSMFDQTLFLKPIDLLEWDPNLTVKNGGRSVSEGSVYWTDTNKVTCKEHGAMLKVAPSGIWRCPACNVGAFWQPVVKG